MSAGELLVVGCNHKTAPLELRETLVFDPEQIREVLRVACGEKVLQETMLLSTCNRTEFYSLSPDPSRAESYVRELVSRFKGKDLLAAGSHCYTYRERDMVRHLFRVAAGLDSMMLGEMQILGQVKEAYEMACEGGSAGLFLHRLMTAALRAGKRARAETEIGAGAVSFGSAAVAVTAKIFDDMSDKRVLVVGAGEAGRLVAQHYAEQSPAGIMVANRTPERAQALAAELGGEPISFHDLGPALARADILVCATRAPAPPVTQEMVRGALRDRGGRLLVCVDLSVPRNVEPSVARLDSVFVYTLEALQTIVDQNLARRRREIPRVEAILDEEVGRFFDWSRSLEVTPLVKDLREHFESVRSEEVRRHIAHFQEDQRGHVEALTRSLVNKLLHRPTIRIKSLELDTEEALARLDAVRELFDLRDGRGGPGSHPERESEAGAESGERAAAERSAEEEREAGGTAEADAHPGRTRGSREPA